MLRDGQCSIWDRQEISYKWTGQYRQTSRIHRRPMYQAWQGKSTWPRSTKRKCWRPGMPQRVLAERRQVSGGHVVFERRFCGLLQVVATRRVDQMSKRKQCHLTGRNRTGPPFSVDRATAHAPDGSVTDDRRRRRQTPTTVWPLHYVYAGH